MEYLSGAGRAKLKRNHEHVKFVGGGGASQEIQAPRARKVRAAMSVMSRHSWIA